MFFKRKKASKIKPNVEDFSKIHYNGETFEETGVITDFYNKKENTYLKSTETDLFNWALKTMMTQVSGTLLPAQVFDILMKGTEPDKIGEILSKISVIESKIDELTRKVTLFKYEDVINKRNTYVKEMSNAQVRIVTELLNADGEYQKIKDLIVNWGEHVIIGGNSSLTQFINFIDFIVDNNNDGMKLYDIYDKYVYMTTPWENMGYNFREEIRGCDFAIILSQSRLAILYYMYNPYMDDNVKDVMINQVKTALKKYMDYYESHKVIRRNDVRVCQIEGCKLEIKKDLEVRHYNDVMSWFHKETEWYEPDYSGLRIPDRLEGAINKIAFGSKLDARTIDDVSENYYGLFTENEINILKNYYRGRYGNMIDMLRNDANMSISIPGGVNVGIMVQNYPWRENEHWYNRNYYIYARIVKANESFDIDWRKIGNAWIDRYGFMNGHEKYMWWDTFYKNNLWLMPHIIKRIK